MVEAQTKATDSPRRDVWCVQLEEVGHTKHLVLGYIRSVFKNSGRPRPKIPSKRSWISRSCHDFGTFTSLTPAHSNSNTNCPLFLSFPFFFTSISPIHAYAYRSPTATKNVLFYLEVIFFEHFAPVHVFNHPFHHHSSSLTDHQRRPFSM